MDFYFLLNSKHILQIRKNDGCDMKQLKMSNGHLHISCIWNEKIFFFCSERGDIVKMERMYAKIEIWAQTTPSVNTSNKYTWKTKKKIYSTPTIATFIAFSLSIASSLSFIHRFGKTDFFPLLFDCEKKKKVYFYWLGVRSH